MDRRPLIAGNWKMHLTRSEAGELAGRLVEACDGLTDREVMIAPPFTALETVARAVAGSAIRLAAQNVHWADKGAFTGEISAAMLLDLGCRLALVGHSERRQLFGESDAMINRRLRGALAAGLVPVLCIGETLEEREAERAPAVLTAQLERGLAGVRLDNPDRLVIAYEPVWAIGTGRTASEEQAQAAHIHIRQELFRLTEKNVAAHMRILYGGSVKPDNIDILMRQPDIDGVLVGGAALAAESFARIIHFRTA